VRKNFDCLKGFSATVWFSFSVQGWNETSSINLSLITKKKPAVETAG